MVPLTISTFPNAKALPLWAAAQFGIFRKFDLDAALHETGSSREQRTMLAAGDIQIVQAAVDNALAMVATGTDTVIVMGGEGGMNQFIVQAQIPDFASIAGGRLLVDSPDTAYALVAREVLAGHGLEAHKDYELVPVGNGSRRLQHLLASRDNTAAVLNPPFTALARKSGLQFFGALDLLFGPYQAGGAFALRKWASNHREIIIQYIRTYLAALDWIRDPDNQQPAIAILQQRLALPADIAKATLAELCNPESGFAHRALLDLAGFGNTVDLRNRSAPKGSRIGEINSCIDLSYYNAAIAETESA
jgi:ABC-type nitrate/sulfonate/bicarbonate transport system substrate-binding protein